ncbi:hypothetical protein ACVNP1_01225 [Staphylococcus aureus]
MSLQHIDPNGITEPLEFSFLFVAPLLFFIHEAPYGLSFLTLQ